MDSVEAKVRCIEASIQLCRAKGLTDAVDVVRIAGELHAFVEPLDKPKTLTLPKKGDDRK